MPFPSSDRRQIRFTQPIRRTLHLSFAVENPAPDLSGAQGVNVTPDFITRIRWEPDDPVPGPHLLGRTAHVQAALLVRTLRGELTDRPEKTLTTGGFGLNVSGVLVPRWDVDDRVKFAANTGLGNWPLHHGPGDAGRPGRGIQPLQ